MHAPREGGVGGGEVGPTRGREEWDVHGVGVEFSGGGRNIKEAGEVAVEEPAWGVPGPLERTDERPGTIAEETSKVENRAG